MYDELDDKFKEIEDMLNRMLDKRKKDAQSSLEASFFQKLVIQLLQQSSKKDIDEAFEKMEEEVSLAVDCQTNKMAAELDFPDEAITKGESAVREAIEEALKSVKKQIYKIYSNG